MSLVAAVKAHACLLLSAVVAFALILWLYWPGQYGPALLDDRSSILVIEDLQANPQLARDYIFGDGSGLLGRWVSMATFVAEKLWLGDSLAISKQVNIVLHLFNGLLLMLLLSRLLGLLCEQRSAHWLALVLGLCWLLAPLHVSTVLYVVQRMAMLSTTFMLLACLAYVSWRSRLAAGRFSLLFLLLTGLCIVLGLFAKENTIVVVPVLFLLEALWYQWRDERGAVIVWLKRLSLGGMALGGLGLVVTFALRYETMAAAFRHRPFSLGERALTQTRALWDYLGQLVWPDLARLGIYHDDFAISTGLNSPPSTLYALIAWVLVLLLCLCLLRWPWGRRLAIGPAWFLAGHAVESSVLPLELYFEHRNYFPVMGLYLALGGALAILVRRMPMVRAPAVAWLLVYAFWLALQTSSQVVVWSQRELIIFNHLNGHPLSPRANMDMAVLMANAGDLEQAKQYSKVAYDNSLVQVQGDFEMRDLALACITQRSVSAQDVTRLGAGNPRRPISSVTTLLTFVRMHQENQCPDFPWQAVADHLANIYLSDDSIATASANIYSTLASLENALQRWPLAYDYILRFRALDPDNTRGQLMQLHFSTALGKVDEANVLIDALLVKQQRGVLTQAEQQTLALYRPVKDSE